MMRDLQSPVNGSRPAEDVDGAPTPLRILVLFGNTPLLGNERANIETVRQLRDRGADVLFLIRRAWTRDSIQKELRRVGLAFRFCPYYDTLRFGAGFKAWVNNLWAFATASIMLGFMMLRWKPTHLHLGSIAWIVNFLPALFLSRIPLVFRAGELPAQHHVLWRYAWAYTARRAAVFVCDSNFMKRKLIELGAPPDRCEVIYAPAPSRAKVLHQTSVPSMIPAKTTILYVGQISSEKGVHLLVEAAEDLISLFDVSFIVAGDFSWRNSLGEELVKRVRSRGIDDRIVFTGFVDDIERLYDNADLHVAPSLCEEGYGLTVVEAKAHGIPSIVFPSGGLSELVDHGSEGWVCAHPTAAALRDALEMYLDDPPLIRLHGLAAHKSLTERLKVQEFGDRWRAVYESARR